MMAAESANMKNKKALGAMHYILVEVECHFSKVLSALPVSIRTYFSLFWFLPRDHVVGATQNRTVDRWLGGSESARTEHPNREVVSSRPCVRARSVIHVESGIKCGF